MDFQALQAEVTAHFPSRALKQRLDDCRHLFSPEDLLYAIFQFAPTFEERIRLLTLLSEVSEDAAPHARLVIDWQNRLLEQFQTKEPGTVYEAQVLETPDTVEETRWLCDSWDAAAEMIALYFREYPPQPEKPEPRRTIVKRRIMSAPVALRFDEEIGICYLGPGNTVTEVRVWGSSSEFDCEGNCPGCEQSSCVDLNFPIFPWQPKTGTPVCCITPRGRMGWTGYGVVWSDSESGCDCFVIPLYETWEEPADPSEVFHDHHHVPCPYVHELLPHELPPELVGHWEYLREQLTKT